MNSLKNKAILYDSDCPMCAWYTGAFVEKGVLQEENRIEWADMPEDIRQKVDPDRSRNEIALVDRQTGEVTYGIDSMYQLVLGYAPWARGILGLRPVKGGLRLLYKLITYNRREMAGKEPAPGRVACDPEFNLTWRIIYIVLSLVGAFATCFSLGAKMPAAFAGNWEWIAIGATGWIGMALASLALPFRLRMKYGGNLATILNMANFLLFPTLLIAPVFGGAAPQFVAVMAIIAHTLIFFEHDKRVRAIGLPRAFSWMWLALFLSSILGWSSAFGWITF